MGAMPFHFKKSEPPVKAVRRVCGERVGVALGELKKSRRPGSVHNARKEIKKLRATLRLVCEDTGRRKYRRAVQPLRRAAGVLAAARDARVRFRALQHLADDAEKRFPALYQTLRKIWRRETRRLLKSRSLSSTRRLLRKAGRRMRRLKPALSGPSAFVPGLRHSYELAREHFAAARREPSPEHLHEWRKKVKDFWYQLQLAAPVHPPEIRRMLDRLELLGEQLGDDHDLSLLRQCAADTPEVAKLNRLIAARQRTLRRAALKLGSQLFDPPTLQLSFTGKSNGG